MKTEPLLYEIRVRGHLDPRRLSWFENLTVSQCPNGETVLVGLIPDQAALHGLLCWLYDIGMPLLSVRQFVDENKEKEK